MSESEVVEELYAIDEFEELAESIVSVEEVVKNKEEINTSSSKDEYHEDFEKEEILKLDGDLNKKIEVVDEYKEDNDFEKEEEIVVYTAPIIETAIVAAPVLETPPVIITNEVQVKTHYVGVNNEIKKVKAACVITNDKISPPTVVISKSNNVVKQPATKLIKPKPSPVEPQVKVNKTKNNSLEDKDTLNKSLNSNSSVTTATRSIATSQRSKPRGPMTQAEKDAELDAKLIQLTEDLAKIQAERKEFAKVSSTKYVNKHLPKFKPQKTVAHKTYGKYEFWHPHLELAIGEIMYSPYLTNPMKPYPKSTFEMVHKLREIRSEDKDFKDIENKPYDPDKLRKKYIKDIMHFNPSFKSTKNEDKDENKSIATSSTPNLLENLDGFGGDNVNNSIPRPKSDSRKRTSEQKKRSNKNLPKLNKIPSTSSLMNGMFADDSILIGPDDNVMSKSLDSSSLKKLPKVLSNNNTDKNNDYNNDEFEMGSTNEYTEDFENS